VHSLGGGYPQEKLVMCRTFAVVFILASFAVSAVPTSAEEFPLRVELRSGKTADFGSVSVVNDDGGLLFEVSVNSAVVGHRADLHRLYFNLHEPTTNLTIETLDTVRKDYSLRRGRRAIGSAGAYFDWSVDFESGRKAKKGKGNDMLRHASFRILAGDEPLDVTDIMHMSASRANVNVQIAAHLRKASINGEQIRTVGGFFEAGSDTSDAPPPVDDVPPPADDGLPAADEGCTWVIDIFTGEPLYQTCG
jgi:hypothetical protein